jgi:hypothetical protein
MGKTLLTEKSLFKGGKKDRSLWLLIVALLLGVGVLIFQISGGEEADESYVDQSTKSVSNPHDSRILGDQNLVAQETTQPSRLSDSEDQQIQNPKTSGRESTKSEEEVKQPELMISGTVLDDVGQLVPGATVVARYSDSPADDAGTALTSSQQLTRLTNNLGSFEFENLDEGDYVLRVKKSDQYGPGYQRVRAGMANAELILQRFREVSVYGQVVDEIGEPLAEVKIRALGKHSSNKSDTNGIYEILTVPIKAGQPPVLDFSLEGFQDNRRRIDAALNPETDQVQLDVQMEPDSNAPKVALSGQVLGPISEPAVGVRVKLSSFKSKKRYSTTSNESGEFDFQEVESGNGYRLEVAPTNDYAAFESDVFSLGVEDALYDISLEPAEFSELTATITDLSGQPLRGFSLWALGIGKNAQSPVLVQTDSSGRIQLKQLRAGKIKLESRSRPWLKATEIVLDPGEHQHLEIPMDWGKNWLLGQVVDTQGQPVAGARVVLSWEERFWKVTSESRHEVMSDSEGFFAASNLGALEYTLMVKAQGYISTQLQYRLDEGDQELRVLLTQNG